MVNRNYILFIILGIIFSSITVYAQTSHVVNNGVPLTVENGVTITFQGNFTNQNAGTIDNDGAITLPGNWTNDAANVVFTANTGTVSFLGTAAQSIGGTNPTDFSSLTINNTSGTGVTLNQDITVSNVLTLTTGILYTSAANVLTMNAGSSNGALSYTSFVSGPMRKIGTTNYNFPVGKVALTRPIGVENLSGSETFTAEYFRFNPNAANAQDPGAPYDITSKDPSLDHVGAAEYWILNRAGAQNANVRLSWDTYTMGVDNLAELAVARWDGATWKDHGNGGTTGVVDPGRGTVISSGLITSFSPFTLASTTGNNPLPIELIVFDAKPNKNVVDVIWSTATEINNSFFTIERSADGINFEAIEIVNSKALNGNSSSNLDYATVDPKPINGVSYYKLKQTDKDGTSKYSHIVAVNFSSTENSFNVYPNPATAGSTINMYLNYPENKSVLVVLSDMQGKRIYSKVIIIEKSNGMILAFDIEDKIAAGMYTIVATSDDTIYNKKLIVK